MGGGGCPSGILLFLAHWTATPSTPSGHLGRPAGGRERLVRIVCQEICAGGGGQPSAGVLLGLGAPLISVSPQPADALPTRQQSVVPTEVTLVTLGSAVSQNQQ